MRLIRKITYKRLSQLPQYAKVMSTFEKFKEDPDIDRHNALKKTKDASTLNYFIVLEFDNIIKKKINIKNFIEKEPGTNRETVNITKLVEEKTKLEESIRERIKKEPACFSKLGFINQVTGCYIVGANKKNIAHIRDLDLKSKNNIVVVKMENKKLPKEIEEMCNQFHEKTQERIKKEQEEFEKFSKMNQKEQDDYINNILNNISHLSTPSASISFVDNITFDGRAKPSGFTFFDGFSEKNIQQIENLQFLETLLANAEEKEQYEFCAKIRDRINEIKSKQGL